MKFFLVFIQSILTVYLAGELARQNAKINALISQVEDNYDTWNERIRNLDVKKSTIYLKKIYAAISIVLTIFFLIASHYFPECRAMNGYLSMVSIFFIFLWVTLQWYTVDKGVSAFKYQFFIFIVSPLLMAFCDFFSGSKFVHEMAKIYYTIAYQFGFNPPLIDDPIYLGLIMAAFGFVMIALQYVYTAMISYPVAIFSIAIVAAPIYFARIVHGFNPNKSFSGFALIISFLISIALVFI
ncbi:hypothetical protein [Pantoea agglomerans]|uniref:hypothetical protein n=1 Tax=Enterobacter agglomerans TaxID=549 RepID=UPI00254274FE|nr:hypothetical protein [Pantoea agglomerans]MDK4218044.1 hypothetical protein [Pantoea agglomerans]